MAPTSALCTSASTPPWKRSRTRFAKPPLLTFCPSRPRASRFVTSRGSEVSRSQLAAVVSVIAFLVSARALADLDGSYVLPLDDWAIQYATRPLTDPVTLLQQRIERGEAKLEYDPDYGYL